MGLETATYIDGLNASNPVGATDPKSQGDDHIRLIKSTILATFSAIAGEVTLTHTQINNAVIKNEANIITGDPSLTLQNTGPQIRFEETDAAADNQNWMVAGTAEQFILRVYNDAYSSFSNVLTVDRTGTTVDAIDLSATKVDLNADVNIVDSASAPILSLKDSGEVTLTSLSFSSNVARWRSHSDGSPLQISADDVGGTERAILYADPDAETRIYHAGAQKITTTANGPEFGGSDNNALGGTVLSYITIANSDLADRGYVGFTGGAYLEIRNINHGGDVRLTGEDTGGSLQTLLTADPDDKVALYYAGGDRLMTDSLGVILRQDANVDTTDYRIRFQHDNGTDRALLGFLSSSTLRLRNQVHGGQLHLDAEDSTGNAQTMAEFDPDASAKIYEGSLNEVGIFTQARSSTGITSSAGVKDHGGTNRDIGFNVLPSFNVNTSDTLEAQHAGSAQITADASAYTLTLEANTSTDFPVGAVTTIVNAGTADYTINEGTGTTLYYVDPGTGRTDTAGGCTVGAGGTATIWRYSSTTYYIWGSEITA